MISKSKYQLDNSVVSSMIVRPMCDLLDIIVDGRGIERCLTIFIPLANVALTFLILEALFLGV